jgi:phosphatidylinositol-3-phosphatase
MDSRPIRPMPQPRSPRFLPQVVRLAIAVAVISIGLLAPTIASAASKKLSAPAMTTPGSTVPVTGTAFNSGESGNLTYQGQVIAQYVATPNGAFTVFAKIPPAAKPGHGQIVATDVGDDESAATTNLVIAAGPPTNPALDAPDTAVPGASVSVSGSGYGPGETGNLTYDGAVMTTFTASDAGSFSVPFPIPGSTTPDHVGRISAKNTDSSLIATTTLTITAGVPVSSGGSPSPQASAGASADATAAGTPVTPSTGGVPAFSHVYVIIMENHEYSSIVGSSSAPYINSLIASYGLATSYDAVSHPSEPNYIALTSGGLQGVHGDGVYNLSVDNLFDQVTASGRTWRSYEQGYPGKCYTGSSASAVADGIGASGSYVRKHNPAISYTSISGTQASCANIANLASFDPAAADFEFITPNLINDMHDGSVQQGDNFLKAFVPTITGSPAFANSVVFVTFDEGTSNVSGGGHVMTIAITPNMTPGYRATAAYSHYSLLRTIEQAWGLPYLGGASSASPLAFPY